MLRVIGWRVHRSERVVDSIGVRAREGGVVTHAAFTVLACPASYNSLVNAITLSLICKFELQYPCAPHGMPSSTPVATRMMESHIDLLK